MIKLNDRVRVINSGETYSNYSDMFKSMGFKNKKANKSLPHGTVATVFGIEQHPTQPNTLYALVDNCGNECLISQDGVELVRETVVDSAKIDSILTRLSKIEAKLDQLEKQQSEPEQPKTPVAWLIDQLMGYDYGCEENDYYDICLSVNKFDSIVDRALEMEKQHYCK